MDTHKNKGTISFFRRGYIATRPEFLKETDKKTFPRAWGAKVAHSQAHYAHKHHWCPSRKELLLISDRFGWAVIATLATNVKSVWTTDDEQLLSIVVNPWDRLDGQKTVAEALKRRRETAKNCYE
jgi:hypothetical protein